MLNIPGPWPNSDPSGFANEAKTGDIRPTHTGNTMHRTTIHLLVFTIPILLRVSPPATAQPADPVEATSAEPVPAPEFMSYDSHLGGALVGTVLRWGLGHVVQGRWLEKGWWFTTGYALSPAMLAGVLIRTGGEGLFQTETYGRAQRELDGLDYALPTGFIVSGVTTLAWETIDLWSVPHLDHNGLPPAESVTLTPAIGWSPHQDTATLGLNVSW